MISIKELEAQAKRVFGPRGFVNAKESMRCEAYRCALGKKFAPYAAVRVSAHNLATAREMLWFALGGMPTFKGEP